MRTINLNLPDYLIQGAEEQAEYEAITLEGTVKLSGILGFWRRNRSSVERRINNLGTCQGAD